MKRIYFYITAAAICLLTACSKETAQPVQEEQPAVQQEDITLISANGNELAATKASIDDEAAFTWNTNDQIAVYSGSKYYKSKSLAADYNNTPEATFEFSGNINAGRKDFALFPAGLVFNGSTVYENSAAEHDAECLTLNLPGEYNLAQVAFNKTPVPMISANAPDGGLAFKNLCALLRFKLVNVPKQTSYITFCFHGKKVYGCFSLTDVVPGESAIEAEDTEDEDVIRVNNNNYFSTFQKGLVINLPVPVGTYTDVTITTFDSDNHKINAITTPINPSANWAAGRRSARKRTAYLPVFGITVSNGVDAGTKVVFAPGNLRATLAAKPQSNKPGYASKWEFAPHQYDAIGAAMPQDVNPEDTRTTHSINSLQEPKVGDVIDLFAWVGGDATGYTGDYEDDMYKYGILYPSGSNIDILTGTTDNYSGLLLDWGHNIISTPEGDYPADTWRILTKDEWYKVMLNRGGLRCRATIMDGETPIAYGLIIAPDQYTHPAGVPAFNNSATNTSSALNGSCSDNVLTLEQWDKIEGAGCVFFPITNIRTKGTISETIKPGDAWYWSSKATTSKNAAAFAFNDIALGASQLKKDGNTIQNGKSLARKSGGAVRLVRVVNDK